MGGVGTHHRHLEGVVVEQHSRSHTVHAAEEDCTVQEIGRERGVGEKKDGGVEETHIGREDLSYHSGERMKRKGLLVARKEGNGGRKQGNRGCFRRNGFRLERNDA